MPGCCIKSGRLIRKEGQGGRLSEEIDPAQAPAEGQAGKYPDLDISCPASSGRMHICVAAVLPDGRTIDLGGGEEVEDMNKLEELVKPLVELLRNNYHPHTTIVITQERTVVVETVLSIPISN